MSQVQENKERRLQNPDSLAILVDGIGIYDGSRLLNYNHLYSTITAGRDLIRALFFQIQDPTAKVNSDKFLYRIRQFGYETRVKETTDYQSWLIGIALEMQNVAKKVDVVALVTTDHKFADICKSIREQVVMEIWTFKDYYKNFTDCCSFTYSVEDCLANFKKGESDNGENESADSERDDYAELNNILTPESTSSSG